MQTLPPDTPDKPAFPEIEFTDAETARNLTPLVNRNDLANSDWMRGATALAAACIRLRRDIDPDSLVSADQILTFVDSEKSLETEVVALRLRIGRIEQKLALVRDPALRAKLRSTKLNPLVGVETFFKDHWFHLEPKTKGMIQTCLVEMLRGAGP